MVSTTGEEEEKIEEVYAEIRNNGPITIEEMAEKGIELQKHLRVITYNLKDVEEVKETDDGWVTTE